MALTQNAPDGKLCRLRKLTHKLFGFKTVSTRGTPFILPKGNRKDGSNGQGRSGYLAQTQGAASCREDRRCGPNLSILRCRPIQFLPREVPLRPAQRSWAVQRKTHSKSTDNHTARARREVLSLRSKYHFSSMRAV